MHVHISDNSDQNFISIFRSILPDEILLTEGDYPENDPNIQILINGVPSQKIIESLGFFKHLLIPWAGLPVKTRLLMQKYPKISVHNIHHNALPVAEMALGLMLTAGRRIVPIDRELRNGNWQSRYNDPETMLFHGKTAMILGFGNIGKLISKRCLAFGMKTIGVGSGKICIDFADESQTEIRNWRTYLPEVSVLFVCVPLTELTRGMIDKEVLSSLPDGAIIVNIARGSIINEEALYHELKNGRLSAGLDVWYNYPKSENEQARTIPSNFPFATLNNVVMTPHLAEHTRDTEQLRAVALVELIKSIIRGEVNTNQVDLERGY